MSGGGDGRTPAFRLGSALVAILAASSLLGLAAPADAAPAAPHAAFTYRMADRYTDTDGDGFPDPATTPATVHAPSRVEFDACNSDGGGTPVTAFKWEADGSTNVVHDCHFTRTFADQGSVLVTLTVTSSNGSDSVTRGVLVKDLLIVSIGDSVASGEGNPYATKYLVKTDIHGNRLRIPIGGVWENQRCHRSEVAGPAQAANYVEENDPRTSVTFVHVACSGAGIADSNLKDDNANGGLLDPYKGIDPEDSGHPIPPQLDQVRNLVGNRRIDALLINISANDFGFGDIVTNCLINVFGCEDHHPVIEDAVDILDRNLPRLPGLFDRLHQRIESELGSVVDPSDIYITQYYDPAMDTDGTVCDPLVPGLVDMAEASWASKSVVNGALNATIGKKAEEFGWHYVTGIVNRFEGPPGHGMCAEAHWVERLEESIENQGNIDGAFHPCAPGQGAYRDAIDRSMIARLGLDIPPPTPGKDVLVGVKCTSPPDLFGLDNRDGDSTDRFGLPVPVPIPDVLDNCPNVPNGDQTDDDHNEVGDACQGFVVNSPGDLPDKNLKDGECPAICTLRAAIMQADDVVDRKADAITFAIGLNLGVAAIDGTQTISPQHPLPAITAPMTIDATTQPLVGLLGATMRCAPFSGHPCIELSGDHADQCSVCTGIRVANTHDVTIRSFVVNRWHGPGVALAGAEGGCDQHAGDRLEGSFVGTDVFGELDRGNSGDGVVVAGRDDTIGGPAGWQRDLISGNDGDGIHLGPPGCASGTNVQKDFIGTDVTGTEALGNTGDGISVNGPDNVIGGSTPAVRNIISGNRGSGVSFFNAGGNVVAGNFIGTTIDGVTRLGNGEHGVVISDSFAGDEIGGPTAASGNIIAFNRGNGVTVSEGTGHAILSNRFFSNGRPNGLGIDIANCPGCPAAVSPNDAGDADAGPNGGQNFPVLTTVEDQGSDTHVVGTLNSAADADFTIQLFTTDACDPSRYGEGGTLVKTFQVHTDAGGDADIDTTFPGLLAPGRLVTATATDPDGNTSEFSRDLSAAGPCAGVYVVNDDGDQPDGDLTDDVCDTGSTAGGFTGLCTLRAAMQEANVSEGRDVIKFAVGSGPVSIGLQSLLPTLAEPVVIDGTSQPGYDGDPLVEVAPADGAPNIANGLVVDGGASAVKGLIIGGFSVNGIVLQTNGGDTVAGNWVGLEPDGTTAHANGSVGILVASGNNVVGGTTAAARNVVSAGHAAGITIQGVAATGNVVKGNFIGTDATGTLDRGNVGVGVFVRTHDNTVGGTGLHDGNVISGNDLQGIAVDAAGGHAVIQGNLIGTDLTGTKDLGNGREGVTLGVSGNTVGGTVASARNVISGNGRAGVSITGSASTGNVVQGNYIGTDVTGAKDLGNDGDGVFIPGGASTIGGPVAGAGNVISGNAGNGIELNGAGQQIQGNRIGLAATSNAALPNDGDGVFALTGVGGTIGGPVGGAGNAIAFNKGTGVRIAQGSGQLIRSNSIFSNGKLGIDLGPVGAAQNDAGDANGGANLLQNYPVLTSAVTNAGATQVVGTLNSTAGTKFVIELFASESCDPSGNGEGAIPLGTFQVTTGANHVAQISRGLPVEIPAGRFITATATDPAGNTSELSACRKVT